MKNKCDNKLSHMHKKKLLKAKTKKAWNNNTITLIIKLEALWFYQWSNMMELEQRQHYNGAGIKQQDNGAGIEQQDNWAGRWKNQDDKERQQKDAKAKGRKQCNIQREK